MFSFNFKILIFPGFIDQFEATRNVEGIRRLLQKVASGQFWQRVGTAYFHADSPPPPTRRTTMHTPYGCTIRIRLSVFEQL